jgi:hypothetical protein
VNGASSAGGRALRNINLAHRILDIGENLKKSFLKIQVNFCFLATYTDITSILSCLSISPCNVKK